MQHYYIFISFLQLTSNFFADKNVQELLRSNLAKNCEKPRINFLRDDPKIDYVPLQMTKYQETMTAPDSGHQHTKKEIQNLIKKPLMAYILPEDFFTESRKMAENSSDYKNALTDETKKKYLNKHENVVGVIGQAGVGKSTLSMILLSRVLKENLYNTDYIFYVKLRDLSDNKKLTLLHFLFNYTTSVWKKEINCAENFLQHLSASDSVVIILDGFDEIEITELGSYSDIKFNIHAEELPLHFTLGLLNGEILPKAKKIITSRPRQLLNLPSKLKPIFLVSILGIDIQGQEQICGNICNDCKEIVWNHVQNQPELNSYCYVPVMAILIFYTIHRMLTNKPNQQTPTNITQVLTNYLCLFIDTKHVRKPINLESLSRLAYEGILKREFYFSDEDFQNAKLQEIDINTFLTTFHAEDKTNPLNIFKKITKKLSYFSHLIWQEFFAAIFMVFYLDSEEFIKICSDQNQIRLTSSEFEVVTKFLFGLCNEHTVAILQTIDKNQLISPTGTVSFLKEYLRSFLRKLDTYINFSSLSDFSFWLYELNDKELTREVSNFLPNYLLMTGDVFPNNVLPLCDLIRERRLDMAINIEKHANFYKNALFLFLKEMEKIIAVSPHIKVRSSSILYFIYLSITGTSF